MAAQPNQLTRGRFCPHRGVTGAPAAADSTDLTTFTEAEAVKTDGFRQMRFYAKLTGGVTPAISVQPLLYDRDAGRYVPMATIASLTDGLNSVIQVDEYPVLLRIAAVSGNPTAIDLYVGASETTSSV